MAAIKKRRIGTRKAYFELATGVSVVAGDMACLDTATGKVTKGAESTTLILIGEFLEALTGNGTTRVMVELARHIELTEWENDTAPNNVTAAHRGSMCYIKDSTTVSSSSNSSARSVAGMVFNVGAAGVQVLSGFGSTGGTGASGNPGALEIPVPIMSSILAAGTPLAAFADGASATPGLALANSKAVGVRWNNHATPSAICAVVPLPEDLDDGEDITVQLLVSKIGATVGDATTFDVAAFFLLEGSLHDADADAGDTSDALDGDATSKTLSVLTVTIDAADVPAGSKALTLTIKPTNGTLGTDDVILHDVKLLCVRSLA